MVTSTGALTHNEGVFVAEAASESSRSLLLLKVHFIINVGKRKVHGSLFLKKQRTMSLWFFVSYEHQVTDDPVIIKLISVVTIASEITIHPTDQLVLVFENNHIIYFSPINFNLGRGGIA